jgi:hypothetical protein
VFKKISFKTSKYSHYFFVCKELQVEILNSKSIKPILVITNHNQSTKGLTTTNDWEDEDNVHYQQKKFKWFVLHTKFLYPTSLYVLYAIVERIHIWKEHTSHGHDEVEGLREQVVQINKCEFTMYNLVKEKSQRKGFQYIIMGYALNKYVIYLYIYIIC